MSKTQFSLWLSLIVDYIIIFNSFRWNENFSSKISSWNESFKLCWNFSSVYLFSARFDIFAYIRNSIFKMFPLNMRDEFSGLTSWNFSLGWKPKMDLFAEIVKHFCKRLYPRCLDRLWMRLYRVRDTYLSKFSYITLFTFFSCFQWCLKASSFSFSYFPWNSYNCNTIGNKIVLERLLTSSNLFLHN